VVGRDRRKLSLTKNDPGLTGSGRAERGCINICVNVLRI
jgi:hypothetical protein